MCAKNVFEFFIVFRDSAERNLNFGIFEHRDKSKPQQLE